MRIFAAGISTETNTFSPIPTALQDFAIHRGKDVLTGRAASSIFDLSQIWGQHAAARKDDFIYSLMAFAEPAGITTKDAYESLRDELLDDLRRSLPVDIVLLMLHGAMIAHGYEDCERDVIQRVRVLVGPATVIGVELDLHCHLSSAKIAEANLVVLYKEYPHEDANERACELFNLAISTRRGTVHPTMAIFDCRMIGLYPTTRSPMREFVEDMIEAERRERVLSISFAHGFPFADIPNLGSKVLAITDSDPDLAATIAREFGMKVYGLRRHIGFHTIARPLERALSDALASNKTPVVVADQSDNAGGGAPSDSTFALRWLLEHEVTDAAVATLYDPEVVRIAKIAGKGATLPIRLGGKLGRFSGDPLDLEVFVLSTIDNYVHELPQRSGKPMTFALGDVAALRCQGIDVVVSSHRRQCFSPSILMDLGIDPGSKRLLVVKSMQHFYRAFAPIAAEVIYMAAPGAVAPDPRLISYCRVDTGSMYPWVENPLGQVN